MNQQRGIFISFEGSEGCGKSTQIEFLRARFEKLGRGVLVTREPGGTAIGEKVRHLLQYDTENANMCAETELLLFTASRAQLVREKLEPALAAGTHVIADRFLDSTDVYQGIARPLEFDDVFRVNRFAVGTCLPDVTFLLDMDAAEGRRRAAKETEAEGVEDRMEQQPEDFYENVRQGYLDRAAAEPDRFVMIDATLSIEEIETGIWNTLTERYDGLCD